MQFEDYYKTLGIARDASADEIKRSYRKLARQFHPDVAKDNPDAAAKFSKVSEANEVLSDPEKRKLYDKFGKDWKAGQNLSDEDFRRYGFDPRQSRATGGGGGGGRGFNFTGGNGADFSDFFEAMFNQNRGGGGGGNPFGGGRTAAPPAQLQEVTVRIGLEEAINGTTRQLTLQTGSGDRTLDIRIPAGVTTGSKIRLAKEGIQLRIELLKHPDYTVDGHDLFTTVDITPAQAALGDKVDLRTPHGQTLTLTVKPNTRTGTRLRIPNQGLPNAKSKASVTDRGNLIARLDIQLPETLSDKQRELYAQLRTTETDDG